MLVDPLIYSTVGTIVTHTGDLTDRQTDRDRQTETIEKATSPKRVKK